MIGGEVIAAKLPKSRVEITNVAHVTGRGSNLDTIPNPVRLAGENVDPTDETRNGGLQCKAQYQRDQTKGNDSCVPVLKETSQQHEADQDPRRQAQDTGHVVLVDRITDIADQVDLKQSLNDQQTNGYG